MTLAAPKEQYDIHEHNLFPHWHLACLQMRTTSLKTMFDKIDSQTTQVHHAQQTLVKVYMLVQWSHRPEKDNWRNKYTVTTRHEILLLNVQVAHNMTANTMLSAAFRSKSRYKLHAAHSV